jgi:hypothetical protein
MAANLSTKTITQLSQQQQLKNWLRISAGVLMLFAMLYGITNTQKTNAPQTFTSVATSGAGNAGADAAVGGAKDGGFAWGDINEDGYLDLVVNTDDNSYGTRILIANPTDPENPFYEDKTSEYCAHCATVVKERSANLADINHDGYLDLIRNTSLDGYNGSVMIYLNRGPAYGYEFGINANNDPDKTFLQADFHDRSMNTEGVFLADYDNDGWLDIVVENHNYGIDIFQNPKDGSANFTCIPPSSIGLPISATDGDYGTCVDYDNDGDVDILARKRGQNDFFINSGTGSYTMGQEVDDANNSQKGGVVFGDFDNDGDFDLYWTDNGTNQIWVNDGANILVPSNGGSGTGEPWASAGITAPASGIDGCAVGDVNNDGKVDLFLTYNSGSSYLFLNQTPDGGSLDFTHDNLGINLNKNGEGCSFADYDNDGDLDLYVNIRNGNNQLWRNDLNDHGEANYLFVEPRIDLGSGVWRAAIGANIVLEDCDGVVVSGIREVPTVSGHGTDAPDRVHFGLPNGPYKLYNVTISFVTVNGKRTIISKQITPAEILGQTLIVYDSDTNSIGRCTDFDQDGSSDRIDLDDDNDGIPDWHEIYRGDHDGDGVLDYEDPDFCAAVFDGVDGWDCADGLPDPSNDLDKDGVANYLDPDFPGCGGVGNGICANFDQDKDGRPNHLDLDSDNDGIPDLIEAGGSDEAGDGLVDCLLEGATFGVSLTVTDDQGCTATQTGAVVVGNSPGDNFGPAGVAGAPCISGCDGVSFEESGGQMVIEAENYDGNNLRADGNDWEVQTASSGYSGTGYVVIPDGSASGIGSFLNAAQLTYEANFVSTGTFYVFARVIAPDGGANSSYFGVDRVTTSSTYNSTYRTNWTWVSMGTINFSTDGDKTIELVKREDGFLVDKFVFSTTNSRPSGTGPAETTCTASGLNQPPTAVVSVSANSGSGPYAVQFSAAASSDSDGNLVSYEWDFGDGQTGTGTSILHEYHTSGVNLIDSDRDGWCDTYDSYGGSYFNGNSLLIPDKDQDGIPDYLDLDSDNDGIPDGPEVGAIDQDGDGVPDTELDSDADGWDDRYDPVDNDPEPTNDLTFKGRANAPLIQTQPDGDGDGKANEGYLMGDADQDGWLNHLDLDSDNDGIPDLIEAGGQDMDGDGRVDSSLPSGMLAVDADQDGFADDCDPDCNNDGDSDDLVDIGRPLLVTGADDDQDGRPDNYPLFDNDNLAGTAGVSADADQDGLPNFLDLDADNDGIPDLVETGGTDSDANGRVDGLNPDGSFPGGQDGDEDGYADDLDPDDNLTPSDEARTHQPLMTTVLSGAGAADGHPVLPDVAGNPSLNGGKNADFDLDGIPNYLDLDSDNDGLTDVVEIFGYERDDDPTDGQDGRVDEFSGQDSDQNGWLDPLQGQLPTIPDQSGYERSGNTLPDFAAGAGKADLDWDGMPNFLDIDADGDGIVDLIEGQPSGFNLSDPFDGLRLNQILDVDHNGLTSEFDPAETGTYVVPMNKDLFDDPDYLDEDTDEDGFRDIRKGTMQI